MATATLASVPTTLDLAETVTNWLGDTFTLEPDIKVQGSNSVACTMSVNGNNDVYVNGFTAADLSAVHLRLWFNISFIAYLGPTNPIQVWISDGTNTAYWAVDFSGYAGGWAQAVVYTGNTPTSGTKPTGNSTQVGMRFVTTSKPRNVTNAWFDAWYYGDGYTVYGGTNGDEISWAEIAAADKTNAYGVVEEINGVYFLGGAVQIGDGTNTTYFKDEGQIAVFKDLAVSSTLYDVTFFDDVSALTNVDISGGTYSAAGTQNYTFDASIADINSFALVGKQFSNSGAISFAAGQSITNCVFDKCGQVDPSTATFKFNSFSNYTGTEGGAVLFPSDGTNFSDLTFSICDQDIEYGTGSDTTSPALVNMTHDDNAGDFDVNNTSGGAVTLALSGTSNSNSYTGSLVTFSSSATLTLNVKDESGTAVSGANAYIDNNNETPFIMNTTTNASGIATTAWTSGAVTGATWRVRKYGYKPFKVISDVPASGTKEIPVTLISDPQQV